MRFCTDFFNLKREACVLIRMAIGKGEMRGSVPRPLGKQLASSTLTTTERVTFSLDAVAPYGRKSVAFAGRRKE